MLDVLRTLSKQRTIQLYADQEEKIARLSKELRRDIPVAWAVRTGLDKVIDDLKKEVANNGIQR
jgi:hypothetical protein